jgi:ATP-dependent Clp protease adaptor protein ClpS
MPSTKPNVRPGQLEEVDLLTEETLGFRLIVWNDDVNTFEWVIMALIEICHHDQEQAEQCALLIHTQGKYAVKHGSYDLLKPMCEAICERSINATIEDAG